MAGRNTKAKETVYTAEQISSVLARAEELNQVRSAADEAGIPWQKVARWKKKAAAGVSPEEMAEEEKAKLEKLAAKEEKAAGKAAPKASRSARKKSAASDAPEQKETKRGRKAAKQTLEQAPAEGKAKDNAAEEDLNPVLVENAVLKEEVKSLKEQVAKLKKALGELL